jgi:hypothetical protein
MAIREDRFIEFVGSLWNNHREGFEFSERPWIEEITDPEERIFAIVFRTFIWNERKEQELVQDIFGGFRGTRDKFLEGQEGFEDFVKREIDKRINFAVKENGQLWKGAHRNNRHKPHFPRTLFDYMYQVRDSQFKFFGKYENYDDAFTDLICDDPNTIYYCNRLTIFDILQRLYVTYEKETDKLFKYHPKKFYCTGGGVKNGLAKIYEIEENIKTCDKFGEELMNKIFSKYDIPEEIAYYKVEDILCLYQKDDFTNDEKCEDLLNGKFKPEEFADIYAERYCGKKEPRC